MFSGLFPELFTETGKNVLFQFHSPNSCQDMSRAFIDVIKIDFKSLFSFHITPTPTSGDFYSSFSYLNSSDKSDVACLCYTCIKSFQLKVDTPSIKIAISINLIWNSSLLINLFVSLQFNSGS